MASTEQCVAEEGGDTARGQREHSVDHNTVLLVMRREGTVKRRPVPEEIRRVIGMCTRTSAYSGRGSLLPTREDTDGVRRPPAPSKGVGAPHQCSRVLKTRSEWGEFVTYIHKNNVPTIANMSECLVEPFRAAAFVPSSSGLFNIPVDWIIATTKRKQCNGIFKPQCTAQLDGGSTISPWTELNSAAYV